MDMNAWEIVHNLLEYGVNVSLYGERLHVENGGSLPSSIIERIKAHKDAIIWMLENDAKARAAGFLPLLPGEVYERQISPQSHVFLFKNCNYNWDAWRETFDHTRYVTVKNSKSVSIKEIVTSAATFDYALSKATKYLNMLKRPSEVVGR